MGQEGRNCHLLLALGMSFSISTTYMIKTKKQSALKLACVLICF